MLRKKTPPSKGESEGPGRILYIKRKLLFLEGQRKVYFGNISIVPRIVACQWKGSSPTGPALH